VILFLVRVPLLFRVGVVLVIDGAVFVISVIIDNHVDLFVSNDCVASLKASHFVTA
jgi:hypothetical protein